jgi:acyl-CoA synthetase (AMP-forming)/AMP-acid ligase II
VTGLPDGPGAPAPAGAGLAALLQLRVAQHPDRACYVAARGGGSVRYAQLGDAAAHWGAVLAASPDLRQRPIGLAIADPLRFAASYVGLLAAGATVAPLDPSAPAQRLAADLHELGGECPALVTDGELPSGVVGLRPPAPDGHPGMSAATGAAGTASGRVLLRSSGTTGNRKQLLLTERQLLHTARAVVEHHRLGPGDRGLCPLPLFHVNAEVVGLLSTLVADAALVIDDRFHRSDFWDLVDAHGVTWINVVPAILAILAVEVPPQPRRPQVRFARSASAPLPVPVLRRFEAAYGIQVLETYGMTEAASQITANPLDGPRRAGSVGLPVATDLRVVDDDGAPCPPGVVGSVQIRGEGVLPGPLPGGWLETGDLGRRDDDGYLYLTGRSGDVINRGGEKIFPREVEEELLADADVTAAVVAGLPDPVLGDVPVAFVTVSACADPAQVADRLRHRCDEQLAKQQRPRRIYVVAALPTGATGKVSNRLARDRHAALAATALARS